MRWINQFELFLFDLDGLLVDTEVLHFEAFRELCLRSGVELSWNLDYYCGVAHAGSHTLRDALYSEFPKLKEQEPIWEKFYAPKKALYMDILKVKKPELLPGVEKLLKNLASSGTKRAVVTNSTKEQVEMIQAAAPILKSIPVWITREQYASAKPAPDSYLKAFELLADSKDRVIGFEDSLRGIQALQGTSALPILICSKSHPQLKQSSLKGVPYFPSFEAIPLTHKF